MSALCLSIHAAYQCRHSGACCSAWMVPAEPHVIDFVATTGLNPRQPVNNVFVEAPDGTPRIAHGALGACVFREEDRCSIHAAGGAMALPVSCRHFPRVVRRDARGTLISLSHYCPTAAAMLFTSDPPRIVSAPVGLTVAEPMEGLDAREALPPLLRPGLLMDVDAYAAWEAAAVGVFARSRDAERALALIAAATERLREWTPALGPLVDAVHAAFATAENAASLAPRDETPDPVLERAIANYLAARTFANWVAYQGRGLRTVVAWIRACHDRVRAHVSESGGATREAVLAAIRATDLHMLHTIDSHDFARSAVSIED